MGHRMWGRAGCLAAAVLAIGSGGPYATAAARALLRHSELGAVQTCRRALEIAAEICIYTNAEIRVLELGAAEEDA